jgi:hypothetical protein
MNDLPIEHYRPHPLFQLMAESLRMGQAFLSTHPTEHQKMTEEEVQWALREAHENIPEPTLSPKDLDSLNAEWGEARVHRRKFPTNPHAD